MSYKGWVIADFHISRVMNQTKIYPLERCKNLRLPNPYTTSLEYQDYRHIKFKMLSDIVTREMSYKGWVIADFYISRVDISLSDFRTREMEICDYPTLIRHLSSS